MNTLRGPGLFLAQFITPDPPFNTLAGLAGLAAWAASLGFTGLQLPTNLPHLFDLARAAESQTYCDEIAGLLATHNLVVTELSTHLQGQLIATHPAYDLQFDAFAPPALRLNPTARRQWAHDQLLLAARASARLGLSAHATFSGALAWPFFYPWPQRPAGLVDEAFRELAARWLPILDAFDHANVDLCFELHPGEDLHDGVTFDRFLTACHHHPRANILYDPSHMLLQQMDPYGFLDLYHPRIRAFHVKDAEFRPSPRAGVYGGYQPWIDRPGRFRSLGDGEIDFTQHLQQARPVRLPRLGRPRVGVLPQRLRHRRPRRRRLHPQPHHPRRHPLLRRLRRHPNRPRRPPPTPRPRHVDRSFVL